MLTPLLASLIATAQPSATNDTDNPCTVPVSVTTTPNATYCNTDLPPERFQHRERTVAVIFKPTLYSLNVSCNGGALPSYGVILACTRMTIFGTYSITLPDPCLIKDEVYAGLVCHELGHVNGWPNYHGD